MKTQAKIAAGVFIAGAIASAKLMSDFERKEKLKLAVSDRDILEAKGVIKRC